MLIQGSIRKVGDNTGVRVVKCIKVIGKAKIGVIIIGSVVKVVGKTNIKRGERVKGVRVNIKKESKIGRGGNKIRREENKRILVDNKKEVRGTRRRGVYPRRRRKKGWGKVVSIGEKLVRACLVK